MPRRLLVTIAALALAASAGAAGCADSVSPAARVGDRTVSHDDLMDEVAFWAESPTLVEGVTGAPPAPRGGNFDMDLVTTVLTNRIIFDIFEAEFDRRGLEVDPSVVSQIAAGLVPTNADASAQIKAELDPTFYDELVNDLAVQDAVAVALGDDVSAFVESAFADVEVSSRFGEWDPSPSNPSVIGPSGPLAPAVDPAAP